MRCDGGEIPFSKGTVILVPPSVIHGSYSSSEFVNISFQSDFGGLFLLDRPVVITGAEDDEGGALARIIYENRFKNQAYLHSLSVAYASYVLEKMSAETRVAGFVRELVEKISAEAFNTEISLSKILADSGFAEDYARAIFKRVTGKTPVAFLTGMRINRARHLIDIYGKTLSLSEVAQRCGYLDYVYFSKRFKELVGVSPRGYKGR